jgi:hypothetical protein
MPAVRPAGDNLTTNAISPFVTVQSSEVLFPILMK